jgi:hypothetical protein
VQLRRQPYKRAVLGNAVGGKVAGGDAVGQAKAGVLGMKEDAVPQ